SLRPSHSSARLRRPLHVTGLQQGLVCKVTANLQGVRINFGGTGRNTPHSSLEKGELMYKHLLAAIVAVSLLILPLGGQAKKKVRGASESEVAADSTPKSRAVVVKKKDPATSRGASKSEPAADSTPKSRALQGRKKAP